MTQEHPITLPLELLKQWEDDILNERDNVDHVLDCAWRNGFQAGADQELEACRLWVSEESIYAARELVEARRPKPPSLKEQALELVDRIEKAESVWAMSELDIIRRALESLPD